MTVIGRRGFLQHGTALCAQTTLLSALTASTAGSVAPGEKADSQTVTPYPGDLKNPPELRSVNGVLDIVVDVDYADFLLPQGPAWLRSYGGMMPGATWRVNPGDQMRISLRNHLPFNPDCVEGKSHDQVHLPGEPHIAPNLPNTTNLHFHGLHVSPKGISDNVYLQVHPQEEQTYLVDIPDAHSVGTYWYHPHRHGSVALQIASGMAGMLIMENPNGPSAYAERHLVVQSPELGPNGELDDPKVFMDLLSEDYFTINGQYRPRIHLEQNVPQYWRLLHANDGQFLPLDFEGMGLEAWVIARDGVPTAAPQKVSKTELAPGNRLDLIVVARQAGEFDMVRAAFDQGLLKLPAHLIGSVVVVPSDVPASEPVFPEIPAKNRAPRPILDSEIVRRREITLSSYTDDQAVFDLAFKINGSPYIEDQFDVVAKLGEAEEWQWINLTPYPHPMHIHVNPFQVTHQNGRKLLDVQWLDTYMVPPAGTATFRMRFEDFDGDFVTHCHILPHEDAGMMMNVRIKK